MLWFLFEGKRQLHIRWARCTKFTNIELRVTDIGLIWSSLRIPKYWGAEQAILGLRGLSVSKINP